MTSTLVIIGKNLPLPMQMQLPKKQIKFCCFSIALLESILNFENFEKKLNLTICEIIDSERHCYRNALKVLFRKTLRQLTCYWVPKNCWNLQKNFFLLHFCHYKLNWVSKSQFYPDEILALLAKTLTAVDEYSRHNTENLPLPIQMQLSKKPRTFCFFLIAFLESTLSFEQFVKKINLIAQSLCPLFFITFLFLTKW